jgi:hypothetical protein
MPIIIAPHFRLYSTCVIHDYHNIFVVQERQRDRQKEKRYKLERRIGRKKKIQTGQTERLGAIE